MPDTVTFRIGQTVVWTRAPSGLAQVEELRRKRMTLLYRRGARICRCQARVTAVAALQRDCPTLFQMPENMLGRGVLKREKTYRIG